MLNKDGKINVDLQGDTDFDENQAFKVALKVIDKIEKDNGLNILDYGKQQGNIYSLSSKDSKCEIHDSDLMIVTIGNEFLSFSIESDGLFPKEVSLFNPQSEKIVGFSFIDKKMTLGSDDDLKMMNKLLKSLNDDLSPSKTPPQKRPRRR